MTLKSVLASIEDFSLRNGVAHGFKLPDPDLLLILHPDLFLRNTPHFARDGDDFKTMFFQDLQKGWTASWVSPPQRPYRVSL